MILRSYYINIFFHKEYIEQLIRATYRAPVCCCVLDKFSRLETLPLRCMLKLLVCTDVDGVWLLFQIGVCMYNVHIWTSRIRDLIMR